VRTTRLVALVVLHLHTLKQNILTGYQDSSVQHLFSRTRLLLYLLLQTNKQLWDPLVGLLFSLSTRLLLSLHLCFPAPPRSLRQPPLPPHPRAAAPPAGLLFRRRAVHFPEPARLPSLPERQAPPPLLLPSPPLPGDVTQGSFLSQRSSSMAARLGGPCSHLRRAVVNEARFLWASDRGRAGAGPSAAPSTGGLVLGRRWWAVDLCTEELLAARK
jgi:hypothetical protein